MNARAARPLAVLTLWLLVATGTRAHAGAWSLSPGEYYSQMLGEWASSDTYYSQSGGRYFLEKGGLVESRSLFSYTELGWKKNMSFVLGIPVRSVTRTEGAVANHAVLMTTTGFADAQLGVRYKIANGASAAALQLDWKPPLSYDPGLRLTREDSLLAGDTNGDGDSLNMFIARQLSRPILGEGQNDLTMSIHLGTALTKLRGFVQADAGYRYRFEDPRDQFVGGGELGFWLVRSLMVAGRYDGIYTLEASGLPPVSEKYGAGTDPDQRFVRHRAGPMLIYRVDDRLDLIAATMHTFTAKNVLHTDEIYVGIAFRHATLNRYQGFLGNLKDP